MVTVCSVERSILSGILQGVLMAILVSSVMAQDNTSTINGQRRERPSALPTIGTPQVILRESLAVTAVGANSIDNEIQDIPVRQGHGRWLRNAQQPDSERVERPRMSREERRQLRHDIRQAGYEVYPSPDALRQSYSNDGSAPLEIRLPGRGRHP